MFSWHETTVRGFCRLAFGLLVAVPTCAVLSAIIWCRCPLSVEYYRRALAEHLALDVRLERVSFPEPHVTLYTGLSLADPETARPLVRFGSLEWRVNGQKSSVTCLQTELLDCSRLDLLAELVARRLRHLAGSKAVVEIQAPQLTLRLADGLEPLALTEVRGQLKCLAGEASEPQGMVEFRLAGQKEANPVRISFDRTPSSQAATTSMKIETGPTPVPSRLIALCCPAWEKWGSTSNFRGELWWQQRADGWAGGLHGSVTGVDLSNLILKRSEHRLSGVAEVKLERAHFERGRLLSAAGSIHAGPGWVGRSLLAAAASQLHATGNNPAAARGDLAAYDEMAFGFAIDEHGLAVEGLCTQSPGAVFVGRVHGRLLGEPPPGLQPLLGVVRMLAPLGEAVPADPAAQSLLSILPEPAAEPVGLGSVPQDRLKKDPRR